MALAARGARDLDGGVEPLDDEDLARALRVRARGVWLRSILVAAALAVLGAFGLP